MNDRNESHKWELVINFVDERKPAVLGWARSKIWTLGYEQEDFIQEAYLAAMKALDVAEQKGKPELLEQYFWVTYKFQLSRLLADPVLLATALPSYEKSSKPENENQQLHQSENKMEEALCLMAPRERRVWELLLGETDHGKCTIAKVAKMFGVSSPRIRQIRDTGLVRVRKHFATNGSKQELETTT